MSTINFTDSFHAFSAGVLWLAGTLIIWGVNRINLNADRWLGTFYYLMACMFTQLFLEGFHVENGILIHLLELPRWAIFPSLYIAVSYLVKPALDNRKFVIHFVPFLIFLLFSIIYLIPGFFNSSIQPPRLPSWIQLIVRYFFFVQIVFYWFACFRLYNNHQKNIQLLSSYTEKIDMLWLKYLLFTLFFLTAVRFLTFTSTSIISIAPIIYFIGLIILSYFTLTQRSIYLAEEYPNIDKDAEIIKKEPEGRLTQQQLDEIKAFVLAKTIDEKLYLDPTLTLSSLSVHLGVSSHDLSYVLNKGLEKNFYLFINEMRAQEAERLLLSKEAKQWDMLGIAIRSGFNSKTTFYSTFKKTTGLTPKEFIKSHKNDLNG